MAQVIVYTTQNCSYCQMAKQFLTAKGVAYSEVKLDQDPTLRQKIAELSGRRTVPQIFINEKPIGGFDDMVALEKAGKLDPLLNEK